MGSPAIFSGKFTKLLTQLGLMLKSGAVINNDGAKNYIGYNNFENGLTTGWSLGTTGTLTNGIPTGTPTFGSGASGTLALTAQSTGPLSGTYSLQAADSAATTAGNMIASDALAVDLEDQAKVLTFKVYYKASANASNGNFSGTSSNTFGIACYDVTNSSWLPVAGNFSITQNSGVGIATGTMQTNATTASVRFMIYCANASAGAITMLFDDFYLGPQTAPIGSVVTDWQSYTPTVVGLGTVSITESQWKREGDSLFIRGKLTTGTTTATTASLSLPSGLVIDPLKVTSIGDVGKYIFASTAFADYSLLASPSGTALNFGYSNGSVANLSALLGNQINVNNTAMSYSAGPIPIQGWSSNVQTSNDTDTRVVTAKVSTTSATTINNTTPTLSYSAEFDSHGAWSTNTYTVPVTGYYSIEGMIANTGSGVVISTNNLIALYCYKNGVSAGTIATQRVNAGGTLILLARGTNEFFFNAGDQLTFRGYCDVSTTLSGTAAENFITIKRLSGPSVIAATESVNAEYTLSAQTFTNAASFTAILYDTKVFDSHNAFNTSTGIYTVPVSGKYRVTAGVFFASSAYTAGNAVQLQAVQAGSAALSRYIDSRPVETTATQERYPNGSVTFNCIAGDTLKAQVLNTRTGGSTGVNAGLSYICIERVGN